MAKPTRYTSRQIAQFVKNGTWQTTVSRLWDSNAEQYPRKKAIEDLTRGYTWAEARAWTDRLALGLIEMGINRDEVVVLQLPNSVELHLLRVACEKAGILCIPVLSNMRESEMKYILQYTKAVALVITPEFRGFNYAEMVGNLRPELPNLRHVLIAGGEVGGSGVSIDSLAEQAVETHYPPDYLESRRYRPEDVSIVCRSSGTTGFAKVV